MGEGGEGEGEGGWLNALWDRGRNDALVSGVVGMECCLILISMNFLYFEIGILTIENRVIHRTEYWAFLIRTYAGRH